MASTKKLIKPVGKMIGFHTPKMPKPEAVREMPDPEDKQLEVARKRKVASRKRTGRTSTVLSDKQGNNLA
jgi:hypothetical protein